MSEVDKIEEWVRQLLVFSRPGSVAHVGSDDHATGARRRQLRAVANVGEEGDRLRRRALERPDAGDAQTGIADQLAAERGGDLAQRDPVHIEVRQPTCRPARSAP